MSAQAELDIQGLTLASIKACVVSLEAHLPLSQAQLKELGKVYSTLNGMVKEVSSGIRDAKNEASNQAACSSMEEC